MKAYLEPQGTINDPIKLKVRQVGKNNHSLIIGVPRIVAELGQIQEGTQVNCYIELLDSKGSFKLTYLKQ